MLFTVSSKKEPVAPVSPVAPVKPAHTPSLRSEGKLEAHVYYDFKQFPRHHLTGSEVLKLLIKNLCEQSNALHAHEVSALKKDQQRIEPVAPVSPMAPVKPAQTPSLRSTVKQASIACAL